MKKAILELSSVDSHEVEALVAEWKPGTERDIAGI